MKAIICGANGCFVRTIPRQLALGQHREEHKEALIFEELGAALVFSCHFAGSFLMCNPFMSKMKTDTEISNLKGTIKDTVRQKSSCGTVGVRFDSFSSAAGGFFRLSKLKRHINRVSAVATTTPFHKSASVSLKVSPFSSFLLKCSTSFSLEISETTRHIPSTTEKFPSNHHQFTQFKK